MGKNKVKKDIFKVAGAQSLKVKTKAKPVKLNLKKVRNKIATRKKKSIIFFQLAPKLKQKTRELDAELLQVQPLLNSKKIEKQVEKPLQTPQIVISQPPITQEDENNALNGLNELQCK